MKAKRQALLVDFLSENLIDSQAKAVELLLAQGIEATQATVSRDLEELGAIKIRNGSGLCYALPTESSPYGISLSHVLREYVIKTKASGNMIVMHTPPGHASIVAAAIDRSKIDTIIGVIAGDDTLFVCVEEGSTGTSVLAGILELAC
jgi:transcriptional regulator of arginine metabolism